LFIRIDDLLTNVTGGPVTLVGVGTDGYNLLSTRGTPLFTNASFILFTEIAISNATDSFQYTVQNVLGQTSKGTVSITVTNIFGAQHGPPVVCGTTSVTVNLFGVPGSPYVVERSIDLVTWVAIGASTASVSGLVQVTDDFDDLGTAVPPVPPSAYYLLRYRQ
jgi:hypothetical protein